MNRKKEFYLRKLPSADAVTMIYQAAVLVIILFNFGKIQHALTFSVLHILLILFLWRLPHLPSHPVLNWIRFWNPLLWILPNFMELHYLVHTVRPHDMDAVLIRIDHWLFGVHPTVWLEKITFPALTEYLQLVYSTFYFLPLVLGLYLYFKNRLDRFDYFKFIMVYGFFLSYLLYFTVPAIGPRFTLNHLQHVQLKGLYLTEIIRHTLNTLERIQRDAFPSGHTAMTVITMYFAYRYFKKYFYVLLVIGTSLIFSTVYLRYHYVVDVLGGLAMAAFVIWTGPYLYRRLQINYRERGQS